VKFTDTELRYLLYCGSQELRARRAGKAPGVQRPLVELVRRLQLEIATASQSGHESEDGQPQSEVDAWITARQAAAMLGLSKRQTTRLAASLGGRLIGGRWLFSASAVHDYAKGAGREHD
jgi:hypothetical protein